MVFYTKKRFWLRRITDFQCLPTNFEMNDQSPAETFEEALAAVVSGNVLEYCENLSNPQSRCVNKHAIRLFSSSDGAMVLLVIGQSLVCNSQ